MSTSNGTGSNRTSSMKLLLIIVLAVVVIYGLAAINMRMAAKNLVG
jgi:hypothetical protein